MLLKSRRSFSTFPTILSGVVARKKTKKVTNFLMHTLLYIRTSNFGAEADRSFFFDNLRLKCYVACYRISLNQCRGDQEAYPNIRRVWCIKLLFSSRLFIYTSHLTKNFETNWQNEDVLRLSPWGMFLACS